MCLSFDFFGAQQAARADAARTAMLEAAASYKSHEVSCNNTQIGVLRLQGRQHKDGGTVVFCRMAAVGDQVMLMYPCEVDCMGKEEEYLVECPSLPCHAGSFEAFTEPERWVRVPEMPEVTMYRGCGGDGDDGTRSAPKVPEVPEGRCVRNMDGSVVFVLRTAELVKTEAEIAAAISAGEYDNKAQYLHLLGKGCYETLTAMMQKHGVDVGCVFSTESEEEHALSRLRFLDELLPNLRPGCNMIVGIPAFDQDKKPMLNGAFSIVFRYPDCRRKLPILGLVHNVDHSNASTVAVEGNFYLWGNGEFPVEFAHPNPLVNGTDVALLGASAFLPNISMHTQPRQAHEMEYSYGMTPRPPDYEGWIDACGLFQTNAQDKVMAAVRETLVQMELPALADERLYLTNLVGEVVPQYTTTMFVGNDKNAAASLSVKERQKRAREAVDATSAKQQRVAETASAAFQEFPPVAFMHRVPRQFWNTAIEFAKQLGPHYVEVDGAGQVRIKMQIMVPQHAQHMHALIASLPPAF